MASCPAAAAAAVIVGTSLSTVGPISMLIFKIPLKTHQIFAACSAVTVQTVASEV